MNVLKTTLFLLTGLLLFPLYAYTATEKIQSSLDRKIITLGETVQLTLSTHEKNIGQSPDITPLYKDFSIISTSTNKQTSTINGQSAALTRWIITLMPKHDGLIKIPRIHLGAAQTNPLSLQVREHHLTDKTDKPIYLVAQATPEKSFEQSQIIYIVRLFYDQAIQNARFIEPSLKNAEMIDLQSDRTYEENVNGHLYQVLEKRYAIFPEKAGPLSIPGPIFTGNILQSNSSPSQNTHFYTSHWKTIRVAANPVSLHVQSPPANIKLGMWLPAQKLKLTEFWSETPVTLTVGEPITRTLSIESRGLTAEQLPSLERWQPKGFKVYLDKPILKNTTNGKTIIGKRIEKYALIPQKSGETTIPKIKLHWWNTATKKMQLIQIPEKTIKTKAAKMLTPSLAPLAPFTTPITSLAIQKAGKNQTWKTLSLGLLILWLSTLFLWWFKHKRRQTRHQQHQLESQTETMDDAKR